MTDIFISARRGAGAPAEILYGTVTFKPTLAHSRSTSIVLPAPTTFDLVDGEVVATNVQPTPEPVAGQIEWAYEVTFKDRHSKTYSFLVGVPDSPAQVNFTSLPRYFETKPPLFGQGPKGEPGESATIQIGSTTSGTTPNVTNSGTNTDAVLNFVLPKGDKGDRGDGVPEGGEALQLIHLDSTGSVAEWVEPVDAVPLADANSRGLLDAVDQRLILNAVPIGAANLNDITVPGKYQQVLVANVTSGNNYPLEGSSCRLEVFEYSKDGLRYTQEVTYVVGGRKYSRYTSNGGSTWTDWLEYARKEDVETAISAIPLADETNTGLLEAGILPLLEGTAPIGSTHLNDLVQFGKYNQIIVANVTAANGYPFAGVACQVEVLPYSSTGARITQLCTNALNGSQFFRRSGDGGVTWTDWSAPEQVAANTATEAYIKPYDYILPVTDTLNFEQFPGASMRIIRSGNFVQLVGSVRPITQDYINGTSQRTFAQLPPDAIPYSTVTQYFYMSAGGNTYSIALTPAGALRVYRHSSGTAGVQVALSFSWVVDSQPPTNFGKFFGKFFEGTEYQITSQMGGNSSISSIAIHGGEVEPGSDECARKLAADLNTSLYVMDGITVEGRGADPFALMHPSSNGYDDPRALNVVNPSNRCVSFHGASDGNYGTTGAVSFVGGLDVELREAVATRLTAAGFVVMDNPLDFPLLAGTNPVNICNRTSAGKGVQIELSSTLRRSFFVGDDHSRPNRVNKTEVFTNYMAAIKLAVQDVT